MVECVLKADLKSQAVQAFEQRGPNRNPGVTFRGAWVGLQSDVVFVLVESAEESLVSDAARSWTEIGDYRVTPVIDLEQF
jgi:Domain of unknown function (DUF3303)